jgi:hypothetical protein
MAACSAVTVGAALAGEGLRLAVAPPVLDSAIPLDVRTGLVYGAAALAFVVAGEMIAPRARFVVALVLYAAGACLAWFVLNPWWFPEHHPRAYQPSRVPLTLTLLGGLAGLLITFVLVQRSFGAPKSDPPLERSAPREAAD